MVLERKINISITKEHNKRVNILAKSPPGGRRNEFILKKEKKFSERKSMMICRWFVNILLVLDEFPYYFLFYFSVLNIFTQFHTTHWKMCKMFSQYVRNQTFCSTFLRHFARCQKDLAGFGVKNKNKKN